MVRRVLVVFLLLLAAGRSERFLRGAVDSGVGSLDARPSTFSAVSSESTTTSKGRRNLTGALQNSPDHVRAVRPAVNPSRVTPEGAPALQTVQGKSNNPYISKAGTKNERMMLFTRSSNSQPIIILPLQASRWALRICRPSSPSPLRPWPRRPRRALGGVQEPPSGRKEGIGRPRRKRVKEEEVVSRVHMARNEPRYPRVSFVSILFASLCAQRAPFQPLDRTENPPSSSTPPATIC